MEPEQQRQVDAKARHSDRRQLIAILAVVLGFATLAVVDIVVNLFR